MPVLGKCRVTMRGHKIVDRDGHRWIIRRKRRYRIDIRPASRPLDELLNYPAIAEERKILVESVRQRQEKGWPEAGFKTLPVEMLPVVCRGRTRMTPYVRRRHISMLDSSRSKDETTFRFLVDGNWVLTKNHVKQHLIHEAAGRTALRFREVRSPVTGIAVGVCDERMVNTIIAARRGGAAPELDGRPGMWAADLIAKFDALRGDAKELNLKTVLGWSRAGCIHLDGARLRTGQEDTGPRRWFVDESQAQTILASACFYFAQIVSDARRSLAQNEARWAYRISAYLLRQATLKKFVNPAGVGRFLLYPRDELEALQKKLWASGSTGARTIREQATLKGVPYARCKTAVWRGQIATQLATRTGTLSKRVRIITNRDGEKYFASTRKRGWAKFDGVFDGQPGGRRLMIRTAAKLCDVDEEKLRAAVKTGRLKTIKLARPGVSRRTVHTVLEADVRKLLGSARPTPPDGYEARKQIAATLREKNFGLCWGLHYRLQRFRDSKPASVWQHPLSRAFFYDVAALLRFLEDKGGAIPTPNVQRPAKRGRPSDCGQLYRYVASRTAAGATVRAAIEEYNEKFPTSRIPVNRSTIHRTRMGVSRLQKPETAL